MSTGVAVTGDTGKFLILVRASLEALGYEFWLASQVLTDWILIVVKLESDSLARYAALNHPEPMTLKKSLTHFLILSHENFFT